MIKAEEFKKYIDFAYKAYEENNITGQAYRQKGKVPYLNHPLWCASMLLADTEVSWKEREIGAKALILHDVLEDTSLKLPDWVEPEVADTVKELTFESWEESMKEYPKKTSFIKLLLLYDKLSSMYERHIAVSSRYSSEEERKRKRKMWKELTEKVIKEVEENYGNIRIVQIGKAIVENTNW